MPMYVLANWKSHKTLAEAGRWLTEFLDLYLPAPDLRVVIAPPHIHLAPLAEALDRSGASGLSLAVQDLSPFPLGAYTGAVAAEMVRGLVDYALVGHSERRRYFHETHQEIANKVTEASAAGLVPILCLDLPYAREQMSAVDEAEAGELLIGYGPVEAMGLDVPRPPAEVRRALTELHHIAPGRPVLYGGAVSANNAADYLSIPGVAGLLVGTAGLEAAEFAEICRRAAGA